MGYQGSMLDEIIAYKRRELAARQGEVPLSHLESTLGVQKPARDLAAALRSPGVSLIAEIKRASPSRGSLRAGLNAAALARAYADGGAAAVSVLTEERYFRGSLIDLEAVREAVPLPLLRKDFVFTPYQIIEARAWGADAVLLIAAVLGGSLLRELRQLAEGLGMAALVEVHDESELDQAISAGATIVGINNRDLRTFCVDLETTHRLRGLVPPGCLVVSESGIHEGADVERLQSWRVDAMLVGEALVQAEDLPAKLAELVR